MNTTYPQRRRLMSSGEKLSNTFLSGIFLVPAWAFLFAIVGGVIAYQAESWGLFWLIFLTCPLIAHWYFQTLRFNEFESVYNKLADAALAPFNKADYYEAGWANSIALNVAEKKFVICKPVSRTEPPKVTELPLDLIQSATAYSPQKETFFLVGNAPTTTQMDVAIKNMRSNDQALTVTGLYFFCDDLVLNKVFVQMSYSSAERWVKALEKLKAGTLASTDVPVDMFTVGRS